MEDTTEWLIKIINKFEHDVVVITFSTKLTTDESGTFAIITNNNDSCLFRPFCTAHPKFWAEYIKFSYMYGLHLNIISFRWKFVSLKQHTNKQTGAFKWILHLLWMLLSSGNCITDNSTQQAVTCRQALAVSSHFSYLPTMTI